MPSDLFLLHGHPRTEAWKPLPPRGTPGNDCPHRVDPSDPDTPPVCFYCAVRLTEPSKIRVKGKPQVHDDNHRTLDHHFPAHRGGSRAQGNGVWCCLRCNAARNDVDVAVTRHQQDMLVSRHWEWCSAQHRRLDMKLFTRHIMKEAL